MNNISTWIVPIIVALLAATPGIIAVIAQRKRDKVEVQALATEKLINSSSTIQDSYKELLEDLRCTNDKLALKVEDLIAENKAMQAEIEELKNGLLMLIDQVQRLGQQPVYRPKSKSQ